MTDPNFLRRDWFATQTHDQHGIFTVLVHAMAATGHVALASHAIFVLTYMALVAALLLMARMFCRHPRLTVLALVSWLSLSDGNESGLGSMGLLRPSLEATQIAGAAIFLAVALLLHRRCLAAGILLGVCGAMHICYAVNFLPVVAAAAWFLGIHRSRRETLSLVLPTVLLWGVMSWQVLGAMHSGGAAASDAAARMICDLRAPHHFVPTSWGPILPGMWLACVLVGVLGLTRLDPSRQSRALQATWVAAMGVTAVTFALAITGTAPALEMALSWRASPWPYMVGYLLFLDLFLGIVLTPRPAASARAAWTVAAGVLAWFVWAFGSWLELPRPDRLATLIVCSLAPAWLPAAAGFGLGRREGRGESSRSADRARAVAFVAGVALAAAAWVVLPPGPTRMGRIVWCLAPWMGVGAGWWAHGRTVGLLRSRAEAITAAILAAVLAVFAVQGYRTDSHDGSHPADAPTQEMANWVRTATPDDAIFVVPLEYETFRVETSRAIVVDEKCISAYLDDLPAWYSRLTDVAGVAAPKTIAEAEHGYDRMDSERARSLATKYDAAYLLVRRGRHTGRLDGLPVAFENSVYRILALPHAGADAGAALTAR